MDVDAVVGTAADECASMMVVLAVDVDAVVGAAAEDGAPSEHAEVRAGREGERCEEETHSVFSESQLLSNDSVAVSESVSERANASELADGVIGSCLMSGSIFTLVTSCNCANSEFTGVTVKSTLEMAVADCSGVQLVTETMARGDVMSLDEVSTVRG